LVTTSFDDVFIEVPSGQQSLECSKGLTRQIVVNIVNQETGLVEFV
jgi:hypothetical protein